MLSYERSYQQGSSRSLSAAMTTTTTKKWITPRATTTIAPRTTTTTETTATTTPNSKKSFLEIDQMLINVHFVPSDERFLLTVTRKTSIGHVKSTCERRYKIGSSFGGTEDKVLVLSYAGSELHSSWFFYDLAIQPGSTVKCLLKTQEQPSIIVRCTFKNETLKVYGIENVRICCVIDLKIKITKLVGLPLTAFRLVTDKGIQLLYDDHILDVYGIVNGDTLILETYRGWDGFLTSCQLGFTNQVLKSLSGDDREKQYQMRVAMYVAAHFGHSDLVLTLMNKHSIRPDEPVRDHPSREWCSIEPHHPEWFKSPIHEASEFGQLGVLRTMVQKNLHYLTKLDGYGLIPLRIALRNRRRDVASFILTKQWTRMEFIEGKTIPLQLYSKIRRWAFRAQERVQTLHGFSKSSLKTRLPTKGPLVGNGVLVDGFSKNSMDISSTRYYPRISIPKLEQGAESPEDYFRRISHKGAIQSRPPRKSRVSDSDEIKIRSRTSSIAVDSFNQKRTSMDDVHTATTDAEHQSTPNAQGQYISTGGAKLKKKKISLDLARAKNHEAGIPLPVFSADRKIKPVYFARRPEDDLAERTRVEFSRIRNVAAREHAIQCLSSATSFKERSWVQQVNIASHLAANRVKRSITVSSSF